MMWGGCCGPSAPAPFPMSTLDVPSKRGRTAMGIVKRLLSLLCPHPCWR